MKITNPNRVVYQKDNILKIDAYNYYNDIADLILPFIKNRPLGVICCHNQIKDCFIKKHPTSKDENINVINKHNKEIMYIFSKSQMLNQVQLGGIEFHIGSYSLLNSNKNLIMVFDLDPDIDISFSVLVDATLKFKKVLDELKLQSYLKTSGGKGYHILVPFLSCENYESFYDLSKKIAYLVKEKYPKLFTLDIRKNKRKGKIFIDYLRNGFSSTCVCPYSLRAKDHISVSFPISWEDIKRIKPNQITIKNYKKYLNDSWKNFFKTKQIIK